jgi:hypothetical protein
MKPETLRAHPALLRKAAADAEECVKLERTRTLESACAAQSYWTFKLRENGQLHVEAKLSPSSTVDDIPTPFPHMTRAVYCLPFDAEEICHHKFFASDSNTILFVMTSPIESTQPRRVRDMGREIAQAMGMSVQLDVVVEDSEVAISSVDEHQICMNGEIYVWFEPNCHPRDHYHFLQHRVQVRIHSCEFRKGWPKLATVELADDSDYTQVQEAVARAISCDKPSHLRFSKHNLETGCPHPQRLPCSATATLRSMLTTSSGVLADRMYVDVCEVPAATADTANNLRFEVFSDAVKYVSTHGVILPAAGNFTCAELIDACRKAAKIEDPRPMRFVDTWKGRIYAVYESTPDVFTETFQALADYRIEFVPQRVVPDKPQRLVQVCHISRTANGFVAHSDGFSLWVLEDDTVTQAMERVAQKLQLPTETVRLWKPCLTHKKEIVEITDLGERLWDQMLAAPVQDSSKVVLSLEHTPMPGTRANVSSRREEGIKIRN